MTAPILALVINVIVILSTLSLIGCKSETRLGIVPCSIDASNCGKQPK